MDPQMSKAASDLLLERHGIYIQPINYPTVPKGTEHLRITATPLHGEALIDQLCAALVDVWTTLALPLRLARLHQTNEIVVGTTLRANPSRSPRVLRRIIARSVVTERAGHTKRAIHLLWRSLQY
jgi:hypothetical protein